METFVAVAGYENFDKFWKTTPREIFALAELKFGKARHQRTRALLADYVEGDS
jgi:hypothetical protein